MLLLELLYQLEQEANGLVMAFHSQSHVAAVLLNHLDVHELLTQAFNDSEECALDKNFRCNFIQCELLSKDFLGCLFFIFGPFYLRVEVKD